MSRYYKVWVSIAVERIDDRGGVDVWNSPLPTPLYVSDDEAEAIEFAEIEWANLEKRAIDRSDDGEDGEE